MRWLLGAIFLLIIGIVFQLGLLVYSMYALLGVILLSRWLARHWIENVTAHRESSRHTVEIGERVAVIVDLANSSGIPIPWLLVEDSLPRDALSCKPPKLNVDGRRVALIQMGPGGKKSIRYQLNFATRGYYQIGPLMLESGDLFGLHRRFKVVTEPHFVMVYPKVIPLSGYDLSSRRPIGEIRMAHRLFEDPTRLAGVREYQRGDSFNRIHWKATASTGKLHSRIYDPSTVAGATIILDLHRDMYPAQGEPHRSELAITTVASLANAVCQMGQQIGLVTNGRDAADRIREEGWKREFRTRNDARQSVGMSSSNDRLRPVIVETQRGYEQFQRIRESLARLELTDGLSFSELVMESASRLPRDATVVAVLGDVTTETAISLGNMRRNGFAVYAIVVLQGRDNSLGSADGTRFLDSDGMIDKIGRLIAEGINVRHIDNEAAISDLCSEQLIR
ncbi:MAG: DUF58 domain-containing protein [Planctomycetota bacterium]|nr:DUF58 domain-containing protein [Planctomycetota bacterium]MDA0920193.1 DUF58 domain-containing protein [Planctomycetota bacterium]